MSRPPVLVFDAHLLIFRAFHSLPDLRAPDGTPTGAVRGYLQTLARILEKERPPFVAAAWDPAMTSFRNDLYPDYKLGRTEVPADLEPQLELCAEATAALGVPRLSLEGYEADDIIATLVQRLASVADLRIVSRDKDLCALVSERVELVDPGTGERTGPAEVEARLGVPPTAVGDYLSLVGDAVDHIPGVRGIGARTAARLLGAFGSLDAIPRDAGALAAAGVRGAERVLSALAAASETLALSRELVRMRDDLPLDVGLADLAWCGPDRTRIESLGERLGLGRLGSRLAELQPTALESP
ncbi:MAG: 5'-3' exonuclease H3TH domain-containing protein [Myxococcota bacterium]